MNRRNGINKEKHKEVYPAGYFTPERVLRMTGFPEEEIRDHLALQSLGFKVTTTKSGTLYT